MTKDKHDPAAIIEGMKTSPKLVRKLKRMTGKTTGELQDYFRSHKPS